MTDHTDRVAAIEGRVEDREKVLTIWFCGHDHDADVPDLRYLIDLVREREDEIERLRGAANRTLRDLETVQALHSYMKGGIHEDPRTCRGCGVRRDLAAALASQGDEREGL